MNKNKIIQCLKADVKKFNRWRRLYGIININLTNANLENADLYNANLRNANLRSANLRNADLYNADLENANLENANLENADLYNANLRNADLRNIRSKNIYSISGIGSKKRQTIYNATDNQVQCGCFLGSFQEFIRKIKKTYRRDEVNYKQYSKAVIYLFWLARLKEKGD